MRRVCTPTQPPTCSPTLPSPRTHAVHNENTAVVALAGWLEAGAGRRATAEQRRQLAELVRLPYLTPSFIGDVLQALPWMRVRFWRGRGGPWRRPSARVRGKRSILSDSRTHTRGKKTLPPVHTPPPAQDALEPRTLLAAFQFAVASEATRARLVAEFSGHPASPPCMRHFRRARPRAALPLTEAGWAAFECACCPAEEGLPRRVPTLQAPPPPPPLPQGAAPAQLCVQARV